MRERAREDQHNAKYVKKCVVAKTDALFAERDGEERVCCYQNAVRQRERARARESEMRERQLDRTERDKRI
jgi:hypothetical protein